MNFALIGCVGWCAFLLGKSVADVGKPFEAGMYSWGLPIGVALITVIPALLGYLAGKE